MAQVFALAFPPSDYASSSVTLSDKKGGAGSRYLLQPALGASLLNHVSLDGSINLSTSSHGASSTGSSSNASRPQLHPAMHYTPWLENSNDDDDDFMGIGGGSRQGGVANRRTSSTLHNGVALSGIASDLARSFDFWDVLRDMRTMASIGKVPGDLGYIPEEGEDERGGRGDEGGPEPPPPNFLERVLGRRRSPLPRQQFDPARTATAGAVPYAPPRSAEEHPSDSLLHRSKEEENSAGLQREAFETTTATANAGSLRERSGSSGPMFGRATSDEWGEEDVNFEV